LINEVPQPDGIYDQDVPCTNLASDPTWDFDTKLSFQPRLHSASVREIKGKHELLKEVSNNKMSLEEVEKALFCLVGLEKAGMHPMIYNLPP
jgi:hypothetical protein